MTLTYISVCGLLFCLIVFYRIHAEKSEAERKEYLDKYRRSLDNVEDICLLLIAVDIGLENFPAGLIAGVGSLFAVYTVKGLIRSYFRNKGD